MILTSLFNVQGVLHVWENKTTKHWTPSTLSWDDRSHVVCFPDLQVQLMTAPLNQLLRFSLKWLQRGPYKGPYERKYMGPFRALLTGAVYIYRWPYKGPRCQLPWPHGGHERQPCRPARTSGRNLAASLAIIPSLDKRTRNIRKHTVQTYDKKSYDKKSRLS